MIVLASQSASRAAVLQGAGVAFETLRSGVDEAAEKARRLGEGATPREVAEHLAAAKALAVSARRPQAVVIGADQTLDLGGALVDKAGSCAEARARLRALRGRRHVLHSALAIARSGELVWRACESPSLLMRYFSDSYLEGYLARAGEAVLGSVGCYWLEGEGAQLIERIDGDYFAILGLPLLPLLGELRALGELAV